jgi:hypothetical protein
MSTATRRQGPILVNCAKKNLATLLWKRSLSFAALLMNFDNIAGIRQSTWHRRQKQSARANFCFAKIRQNSPKFAKVRQSSPKKPSFCAGS